MPQNLSAIDRYRILRPIAAGGMAEVFEVVDITNGQRLALKVLSEVQSALKRFEREYEAMTRLNHPNIVRVYHYGIFHKHPWVTMELLSGMPAQKRTKKIGRPGKDRTAEAVRVAYHVAKALSYLTDRQIIHRDLKSANVLVLPDGRVKLLDFGAAFVADAAERITKEGEFVGTIEYAAPEQLRGEPLDHRVDLYALGTLLYRLVTAKKVFSYKDVGKLARAQLLEVPRDPRELVPSVPKELANLINRLLEKNKDKRPPHAEVVASELEAIAGGRVSTRFPLAIQNPVCTTRVRQRLQLVEAVGTCKWLWMVGEAGSDVERVFQDVQVDLQDRGWKTICVQSQRSELALLRMFRKIEASTSEDVTRLGILLAEENIGRLELRLEIRDLFITVLSKTSYPIALIFQSLNQANQVTIEILSAVQGALHSKNVVFIAGVNQAALNQRCATLPRGRKVILEPLTPAQVAVAVGNMLGRRPPHAELARRLHDQTGGQPLYLEQAVREMVSGGQILADDERVAWADQRAVIATPTNARKAALSELALLAVVERRVLEAVAVVHDFGNPATIATMLQWSIKELAPLLKSLVTKGFLKWTPSMALRWMDPIVRQFVLSTMRPCRMRLLQRCFVSASVRHPPTIAKIRALLATRQLARAAETSVARALGQIERDEARDALDSLSPVYEEVGENGRGSGFARLYLMYARVLTTTNPQQPAIGRCLKLARECMSSEETWFEAHYSWVEARRYLAIGHISNFEKHLTKAWEQASEGGHSLAARVALDLYQLFLWRGELSMCTKWRDRAETFAEQVGDPRIVLRSQTAAGRILWAKGDLKGARTLLNQVMNHSQLGDDRVGRIITAAALADVLRAQGHYSQALKIIDPLLPVARQSQDASTYVALILASAWCEHDLGRLGRAQEGVDELAAMLSKGEYLHLRMSSQLLGARIHLASGRMRSALWASKEVFRQGKLAGLTLLRERARVIMAESYYRLGEKSQAQSLFASGLLGLMGAGHIPYLAEAVISRSRCPMSTPMEEVFRPLAAVLSAQDMPLVELHKALTVGHEGSSMELLRVRDAAAVLERLTATLADTEKAAIRVHPMSAHIRRVLG